MTIKINVNRLTILRDHLKTIKKGNYDQLNYELFNEKGEFAGCAFGHATQLPAFKKAGYKMHDCGLPYYKGAFGSAAAANFFGLDDRVANWLSGSYKSGSTLYTPKTFLTRLDAVLEDRITFSTPDEFGDVTVKIKPRKKVKALEPA